MILWLGCGALGTLLLAIAMIAFGRQYRQRVQLQLEVHLLQQHLEAANETGAFLKSINQSLIQQAPTAMLLVDEHAKLLFFNPAAERWFGLFPTHMGRPLIQVVRDHDLGQMVRGVLDGLSVADDIEIRPLGHDLVLRASARPIGSEIPPRGAAIVVQDLTELHRLEAVRREFVANVSHELRTPLTTVKAMVDTLRLDGLADIPQALRYLAGINNEIDHLATLIRDLLDLSRIESGRVSLQLQPLPLSQLVAEAVDNLRQRCEHAGIVLECRAAARDITVMADPHRTQQILLNLVDNAIKFTPAPGVVSVSIDTGAEYAQVTVRDTGVGIPEEDRPRIFERFYKVDKGRARQDNPGTGLGLAIVKHLVGAMGGGVEVASTLGHGSTFSFTLPLAGKPSERQLQEATA